MAEQTKKLSKAPSQWFSFWAKNGASSVPARPTQLANLPSARAKKPAAQLPRSSSSRQPRQPKPAIPSQGTTQPPANDGPEKEGLASTSKKPEVEFEKDGNEFALKQNQDIPQATNKDEMEDKPVAAEKGKPSLSEEEPNLMPRESKLDEPKEDKPELEEPKPDKPIAESKPSEDQNPYKLYGQPLEKSNPDKDEEENLPPISDRFPTEAKLDRSISDKQTEKSTKLNGDISPLKEENTKKEGELEKEKEKEKEEEKPDSQIKESNLTKHEGINLGLPMRPLEPLQIKRKPEKEFEEPSNGSSDNRKPPPGSGKDVGGSISSLVENLAIDGKMGTKHGICVITLAGENKGASMVIGPNGSLPIYGQISRVELDEEKSGGGRSTGDVRTPILCNTSVNSNTQGVNNSILDESCCYERDAGVHLVVAALPLEAAKAKEEVARAVSERSRAIVMRSEEPTTVRRRCLRALFMENSDEEGEGKRRHGCKYSCGDKSKFGM